MESSHARMGRGASKAIELVLRNMRMAAISFASFEVEWLVISNSLHNESLPYFDI